MTAFVLATFATYRITRFIVKDTFPPILWVRKWVAYGGPQGRKHPDRFVGQLVSCNHCVSVYVAALVTLGVWLVTDIPLPFLFGLAVAGAVSVLAEWVE